MSESTKETNATAGATPTVFTVRAKYPRFHGPGPMELKFSDGEATTTSFAAAEYAHENGYDVSPNPYDVRDAQRNDGQKDKREHDPSLKWCVVNREGQPLAALDEDDAEIDAQVWLTEPGAVIGFARKKDATAFIKDMALDGCAAVELPDGFTAHEAPGGTDSAD